MIEENIKRLIQKIVCIQNAHKTNPGEESLLSHDWEFIFSEFDGWIVLSCSTQQLDGYHIYPTLYPLCNVATLKSQLPDYNVSPHSAAYYHVSNAQEDWIEPCWGLENSQYFDEAEIPLFFQREYWGYPNGQENYYEFNQMVTHLLDLHWSAKRKAYCCVNKQGDEIEKIKIIPHDEITLIVARRIILENLLYLGKWALVRYFYFRRFTTSSLSLDSPCVTIYESEEYKTKVEVVRCKNEYIKFKGAHIEQPRMPKGQPFSWSEGYEEPKKKYADFIIKDWKNDRILNDYSIHPSNFSNYFTESDLPYETSPVFFKAEVLDKYKNNPDKYDLGERNIGCRGGWYLQTYDINEYGQVHTYAVYLAQLPYKEQLHWLQYNEKPKGSISERAFQTDFEAKFPNKIPKLQQLRESLEALGAVIVKPEDVSIWAPKGGSWESASKGLYYVNTENPNQWQDFVMALANASVEGFEKKPLSKIALRLGCEDVKKLGTLGLIKFILKASQKDDKVSTIYGVLHDLRMKRNKGKAHGVWDTPEGSLIEDASKRLHDTIVAIIELKKVLESL